MHNQTTHAVPVNRQVIGTLHIRVRETAAYSNHSCCSSKSPSDRDDLHVSVWETAAYSNLCCPNESPSVRDPLHDSVEETAAYSNH